MRCESCENCGNFGTRNGQYCSCAHGISLKIKNGHHERDPEIERIARECFEKYDGLFKRLADS